MMILQQRCKMSGLSVRDILPSSMVWSSASRHARQWIAGLEAVERQRSAIKSLKVGYNKVFGYYIEVTKANAGMVPPEYIRKQTLVNAEPTSPRS